MQPLEKSLRNTLEKTVKEARDIAEEAARSALGQLGVSDASAPGHLTEEERELRRKLRIHGRQLGDALGSEKVQSMDRLLEEVAYEHWHRMLFAWFLAENNLLMYPDPDESIAISLEECEDLAADEGAANGWELAARFAARMLPQIFRPDSPVFQLVLPPEHQQQLERLVANLPSEVFIASDSLGWVYQFWQSKRKDEVNAQEIEIGAQELSAVTQLFTEPYMVAFLLDNSLGAWWAARRLSESDLKGAKSEEELRTKASIPGVPLEYLRFSKKEEGPWSTVNGTFDDWPEKLSEFKTLDPCCGSGHFLVAAFLMLVPMRMELEELSSRQAVNAVLRENIHGLEIDKRCVELACFALALAAWKYPCAGSYRPLPNLNIACSGLSIRGQKEEWLSLAEDHSSLRLSLEALYSKFKNAPILGSLISPVATIQKTAPSNSDWQEVEPLLFAALEKVSRPERHEMAVVAHGLARVAKILSQNYCWIITNVPFLARGRQVAQLRKHVDSFFELGKSNLAVAFLLRLIELSEKRGAISVVVPRAWMTYTEDYSPLREYCIKNLSLLSIAALGKRAFETIGGEVVDVALLTMCPRKPSLNNTMGYIDLSDQGSSRHKSEALKGKGFDVTVQSFLLQNPGFVLTDNRLPDSHSLSDYVETWEGLSRGDTKRFDRYFWELSKIAKKWSVLIASEKSLEYYWGRQSVFLWESGIGEISRFSGARIQGKPAFGKPGIFVSRTHLSACLTYGEIHAQNGVALVPKDEGHLAAILSFCKSAEYREAVKRLNQKLIKPTGVLDKVPFDLQRWANVSKKDYPNGLSKPFSDDPRQFIFHGHPCGSVVWDKRCGGSKHGPLRTDSTVLQVAVIRLLGYRWPAEFYSNIDISDEQQEWVARSKELATFSDDDGIVCIPALRGEASAADRLVDLLNAAYGNLWSNDIESQLLRSSGHAGKELESWLRDKFFLQHCRLFQQRPFIWHIWDGQVDGFSALVNYHKLDYKNLETLIYNYLEDWISRQKQDIRDGVDGARVKLEAAEDLKKKLELVKTGEVPYDIFVRWKPLSRQPRGWNPDLRDGVRINIRPFMTVPHWGKSGAGVLRIRPNISWENDSGKDVSKVVGKKKAVMRARINNTHIPLSSKQD